VNSLVMSMLMFATVLPMAAAPPNIGEKAPDFKLSTPEGRGVQLS